ncbi:spermatogenesis-associated protein 4 isoform X2 [Struthio camelus]|uniref:spermatogenesis-associated protein 4 isoform X2 n=1 Tax=Struthio camelus TaxID=8801 RepID=UPI003603B34F
MAARQPGLPRAVLRWLQSLDLSVCPRHCRRDFSNGYLVAEILSCYYPRDIQRSAYGNGSSLAAKLSNWSRLRRFFAKQKLNFAEEVIDGTIHCKPGAAEVLVQDIYSMLTNRRLRSIQDREVDFTDYYYQAQLPMAARSTASKAIKNNIKLTEIMTEPSVNINRQKANTIINMHMRMRMQEREEDPQRFNIKPSLGQRALCHPSCTTASENTVSILKEKFFAASCKFL